MKKIIEIPDDVIRCIFTNITYLQPVRQVCRDWKRMCPNYLTKFEILDTASEKLKVLRSLHSSIHCTICHRPICNSYTLVIRPYCGNDVFSTSVFMNLKIKLKNIYYTANELHFIISSSLLTNLHDNYITFEHCELMTKTCVENKFTIRKFTENAIIHKCELDTTLKEAYSNSEDIVLAYNESIFIDRSLPYSITFNELKRFKVHDIRKFSDMISTDTLTLHYDPLTNCLLFEFHYKEGSLFILII